MLNANKAWRKAEEAKLVEKINEYLNTMDWDSAMEKTAVELGRTVRGVKDRWNLLHSKKKRKVVHVQSDYGSIVKSIAKLIEENEQLKQRIAELEKVEAKFNELGNYMKEWMK